MTILGQKDDPDRLDISDIPRLVIQDLLDSQVITQVCTC